MSTDIYDRHHPKLLVAFIQNKQVKREMKLTMFVELAAQAVVA